MAICARGMAAPEGSVIVPDRLPPATCAAVGTENSSPIISNTAIVLAIKWVTGILSEDIRRPPSLIESELCALRAVSQPIGEGSVNNGCQYTPSGFRLEGLRCNLGFGTLLRSSVNAHKPGQC